ncbi:hypothetical protein ANAPH1_01034 [Anaplasma phagocytophilum]|nr:hypothetical protein ANAPH1_01034 [Anaplasma phagocytophilum]
MRLSGVTPTYTETRFLLKSCILKSLEAVAVSIRGLAHNSKEEFMVEITPERSLSAFCKNAAMFIYATGCIFLPIVSNTTARLYTTSSLRIVLTTSPNDLTFSGTANK